MSQDELKTILAYIEQSLERKFEEFKAQMRPNDDEMTERQAFDEFGRGFVQNCVDLGLVVPLRAGKHKNSRKVYYRSQLQAIKRGGRL